MINQNVINKIILKQKYNIIFKKVGYIYIYEIILTITYKIFNKFDSENSKKMKLFISLGEGMEPKILYFFLSLFFYNLPPLCVKSTNMYNPMIVITHINKRLLNISLQFFLFICPLIILLQIWIVQYNCIIDDQSIARFFILQHWFFSFLLVYKYS